MKYFKPYLFHSGAIISLADGSGKTRLQRVEQASYVIQAHDLFGLREHIGAVLSLSVPDVGAQFGKRNITRVYLYRSCSVPADGFRCQY
jgi:hypothetical protein